MTTANEPKVLILAGQRAGTLDPLAAAAGVTHKCLVPVEGQSLIGRVLDTVEHALSSPIFISIEREGVIDSDPSVVRLRNSGRLQIVPAEFNLVDSVRAASDIAGFPLLITTADNVLLTVEALQQLVQAGERGGSEAILAMARKEDIQAAHRGGKNRYYEFRDGGFSNCNLFWLGDSSALKAAEAFREGGQFLKVAGRIVRAFGFLNLLLFRSRLLTLDQAFRAISRRLGVGIEPLLFGDGRLAIDVDDERSKKMVEELLRERSPDATQDAFL